MLRYPITFYISQKWPKAIPTIVQWSFSKPTFGVGGSVKVNYCGHEVRVTVRSSSSKMRGVIDTAVFRAWGSMIWAY